jgi:hypothetical protein
VRLRGLLPAQKDTAARTAAHSYYQAQTTTNLSKRKSRQASKQASRRGTGEADGASGARTRSTRAEHAKQAEQPEQALVQLHAALASCYYYAPTDVFFSDDLFSFTLRLLLVIIVHLLLACSSMTTYSASFTLRLLLVFICYAPGVFF